MVRSCQREFSRAGRAVQAKRDGRRVCSDTVGSCRLDIQPGSQRLCPIPLFNRQLLESSVKSSARSVLVSLYWGVNLTSMELMWLKAQLPDSCEPGCPSLSHCTVEDPVIGWSAMTEPT